MARKHKPEDHRQAAEIVLAQVMSGNDLKSRHSANSQA